VSIDIIFLHLPSSLSLSVSVFILGSMSLYDTNEVNVYPVLPHTHRQAYMYIYVYMPMLPHTHTHTHTQTNTEVPLGLCMVCCWIHECVCVLLMAVQCTSTPPSAAAMSVRRGGAARYLCIAAMTLVLLLLSDDDLHHSSPPPTPSPYATRSHPLRAALRHVNTTTHTHTCVYACMHALVSRYAPLHTAQALQ